MYCKDLTMRITTRITEEQYQTLLELARTTGGTISSVLQQIIDSYTVRIGVMNNDNE